MISQCHESDLTAMRVAPGSQAWARCQPPARGRRELSMLSSQHPAAGARWINLTRSSIFDASRHARSAYRQSRSDGLVRQQIRGFQAAALGRQPGWHCELEHASSGTPPANRTPAAPAQVSLSEISRCSAYRASGLDSWRVPPRSSHSTSASDSADVSTGLFKAFPAPATPDRSGPSPSPSTGRRAGVRRMAIRLIRRPTVASASIRGARRRERRWMHS